jgi:hypothetical protein
MPSPFASVPAFRRRSITFLPALLLFIGITGAFVSLSHAATANRAAVTKQRFDVPAGDARPMLRLFANQAGCEIMFPVDNVAGVKTNAVKGEFTIQEALAQILAETGLVASLDAKTGAIAIRKDTEARAQNERGAARRTASDRPVRNQATTGAENNPGNGAADAASGEYVRRPIRVTAADLARYDLNRNGRLDGAEIDAWQADRASDRPGHAAVRAVDSEEAVQLSPFEVREDTRGYYAANTMSGTRINTRLEDLAASISVVTKQQMSDFGLLDIHDIFNYEANTEGMGNYTAFTVDQEGNVSDQLQDSPETANRVRGIGPANIALDNFGTSGRVPIDPIGIDAIEISRGPNSNIFGLGNGSGTVNLVSSSAHLNRPKTTAETRIDDRGGWRTSLDISRPIVPGKLAIRASGVYQHDAYSLKPSGMETRRFNFMVRAQPFKRTSLRASFQSYHAVGNRPNSMTPRDAISHWKSLGGPTWDPTTSTVTVNGQSTFMSGTTLPPGLENQDVRYPNLFVDGGVQMWRIGWMPAANATNGPNNTNGTLRMLESTPEPITAGRPLFGSKPGVSDRSIYDWGRVNLAAPNARKDQIETSMVALEHTFLDGDRHKLGIQLAWQREDGDRISRNIIGQEAPAGGTFFLYVDPNEKLLDGQPNPYFLRPYLGLAEPSLWERPFNRDSYRGQAVYVLDLAQSNGRARWLGRHQFVGYQEERKNKNFQYRYRDVMTSDHPLYAPPGQPKGNQTGIVAPAATRLYYHFYVGDNQGQNVDYAPSGYELGNYTFHWFDPRNSQWVADPATLGRAAVSGAGGSVNVVKTRGGMIQSSLLQNRMVTTFGIRGDDDYTKQRKPSVLKPSGWEFDFEQMDGWVGDWAARSGETRTTGVVVRPFRRWSWLESRRSSGGLQGASAEMMNGLQLHYNQSDSFRPVTPAVNIMRRELPNPSSKQNEFGFSLNVWNNKIVLRANRYETTQINSTSGPSGTIATRALRIDYDRFKGSNDPWGLQNQARLWVTATNPGFSSQQVEEEVYRITGLSAEERSLLEDNPLRETGDLLGKGEEYELNFNPTSTWTLRLNATRQETTHVNLSPNISARLAERMPIWTSIIDPRTNTPWFTNTYNSRIPRDWIQSMIVAPLELAQALEGKRNSQSREWRVNLSTSFRLSNITENKHLKRMNIGGAVRWQSEGTIGYYGIPVGGDMGAATSYDPTRPINDKAITNIDAFVGYTTHLFRDRIRARFQLNVRNVQESGRLQAVGAYPDGRGHTFRIIDPRMFIFSTTFDL